MVKKVYEGVGVCPSCGEKTFHVELYEYNLPVEGPSIIFVGRCSSCGFRTADVIPLEGKGEKEVKIDLDRDSLSILVYLPPNSEVIIPEGGIEARFTPVFKGRITTVEGVLRLLAEDVKSEELEAFIKEVLEGKRHATLVIRNPDGMIKVWRLRDEP